MFIEQFHGTAHIRTGKQGSSPRAHPLDSNKRQIHEQKLGQSFADP
jgi:hypothetical protein